MMERLIKEESNSANSVNLVNNLKQEVEKLRADSKEGEYKADTNIKDLKNRVKLAEVIAVETASN